jgi:hypothetical protein
MTALARDLQVRGHEVIFFVIPDAEFAVLVRRPQLFTRLSETIFPW